MSLYVTGLIEKNNINHKKSRPLSLLFFIRKTLLLISASNSIQNQTVFS